MEKEWLIKTIASTIVVLFIGSGIVSAFNSNLAIEFKLINLGNWLYVGGSGEGNYTRIQDAINNASDGDTVYIYDDSSPYLEELLIQKSITIYGEDRKTTIIDGDNKNEKNLITILSNNVNIYDLTIRNCYWYSVGIFIQAENILIINSIFGPDSGGIELDNANNITIFNNLFVENDRALILKKSQDNFVISNIINDSKFIGILLIGSNNNIISANTIKEQLYGGSGNVYNGILLSGSGLNLIKENTFIGKIDGYFKGIELEKSSNENIIQDNNFINCGFYLDSFENTLEENTINGKPIVFLKDKTGLTISNAGQVICSNCESITIENLDLSKAHYGIELNECTNCIIKNNTIANCNRGIYIGNSQNNQILDNNIKEIYNGISLFQSDNCKIFKNLVLNSEFGITLEHVNNNEILNNKIEEGEILGTGIIINFGENNRFQDNVIKDQYHGIDISRGKKNIFVNNEIYNNSKGINIWKSNENSFTENNIIENYVNSYFWMAYSNKWNKNFWGTTTKAIIIRGVLFYYAIYGPKYTILYEIKIPWINFDWHPVQEPYDIPIGG